MSFKIEFDDAAIMEAVRNAHAATIAEVTEKVAGEIPEDVEVLTQTGVNDNGRPYGLVTIAEPHGMLLQAKHGYLTKAASALGLTVSPYGGDG
ncbi:hypothetical protein [Corynebacterium silvaticum]|uniref:Uncharacterized protein n=1 Tax=Corynebacterium silvaticum TaxID=2320431 RepID=A0A7Y4LH87_9CORY|nr:hypothetical protein [Corynebacterium silvaticum]ARU46729.1 hypothetical protein CBE74_10015 [Corynebacterium silvaticum]NON70031.1 hypothetical protein [Corynebacterium silvaticum]UWG99969.1 hypothetical protein K1I39_09945 [Corynebacterium silvaticum]UWH02014.1 hypothetical protein K1I38_09965 [Corynebacterium silvaticum]UWH04050.1 hypothetical protein K1I36_09965 [Corynebacterium silvaticum]